MERWTKEIKWPCKWCYQGAVLALRHRRRMKVTATQLMRSDTRSLQTLRILPHHDATPTSTYTLHTTTVTMSEKPTAEKVAHSVMRSCPRD
jgi:hypothetical protein